MLDLVEVALLGITIDINITNTLNHQHHYPDRHQDQHHQSDRLLITAILVALVFFGGASGPVLDAAQLFRETAAVIKSAFKQIIESK